MSHTINILLSGSTARSDDPTATPLESATDARNHYHFIAGGQTALPFDSMGNPWCSSQQDRVHEMVDPVAREMGHLLVRGGTHIVAYANALEALSGVDIGTLLPIPDISNTRFPETMKHEAKGLHRVMCRMSSDDYREIIWRGPTQRWFRASGCRWSSRRRIRADSLGGATVDVTHRSRRDRSGASQKYRREAVRQRNEEEVERADKRESTDHRMLFQADWHID